MPRGWRRGAQQRHHLSSVKVESKYANNLKKKEKKKKKAGEGSLTLTN